MILYRTEVIKRPTHHTFRNEKEREGKYIGWN